MAAFGLAACGVEPEATEPAMPTESPTALMEVLECDGPISPLAGTIGQQFAFEAPGATPDEALAAFLELGWFAIPRTGYEWAGPKRDPSAYVYRVDGRTKIAVLVSTRFAQVRGRPFAVEELRACPEAEWGAQADFGPERRVWSNPDGLILTDIAGAAHCGWESARLLHIEVDGRLDRQYVRDPEGVLPLFGAAHSSYGSDVDLPDDAFFSGYRSGELELWFVPDDHAAYVVTPDGVERWPRVDAEDAIGCA